MRRIFFFLLAACLLMIAVGQAAPTTTNAAKPVDYYALSGTEFFKLPALGEKIKKDSVNVDLLEAAIFHQTNIERVNNKLPIFKHGWAVNLMARRYSQEMSDLQFFDHVSPAAATHTLADRLKLVGLVNVTAGENIAVLPAKEMGSGHYIVKDAPDGSEIWKDQATGKIIDYYTYQALAETVVTQWMHSPPHHANLVKKEYVYLGVGAARGSYGDIHQDSFYMTQNFSGSVVGTGEVKAKGLLAEGMQPK